MLSETIISEGEEKFIRISINGHFKIGARCNRIVEYNNLTIKQIKAWLNGHLIVDTGHISKENKLEYEFDELIMQGLDIKKGDRVRYFGANRTRFEGIVLGFASNGNAYMIETGSFTYMINKSAIFGVNGVAIGRLDQ